MAKLIYAAITSLDGYVADADGNFDWAEPDEEVFTFVNDLERSIGTYLYGRRMYEVMVYWETFPTTADQPPVERDFAELWQAADKIVYSTTLESVSSARTRIERGDRRVDQLCHAASPFRPPTSLSKYGALQPPYLKTPEVSSSGPPGACMTPSSVRNV